MLHMRLTNTFLWKRYQRQKQGIVDVLLELNHDSRVNIELQIKMSKGIQNRDKQFS